MIESTLARRAFLAAVLIGFSAFAAHAQDSRQAPTRVMLIPSMHRFHQNHPTYDYDRLYNLIRSQQPDLVGVEIRPEDMAADDAYLSQSYPPEMIALRNEYGARAVGFDWLGNEIAGRPIPEDFWREQSVVKRLERQMARDAAMESAEDDALSRQQAELLQRVTPHALADGRYDRLVRARRALLARLAGDGPYAPVVQFTAQRERRIGDNIAALIRANPGRTMVFVMGADHHGYAAERLRREFGNAIVLADIPE